MYLSEIITWFFVVVVLAGLFLNARRHWSGFILWMVGNVYWFWHNLRIDETEAASLFAIYFVFSAYGIWSWRKKQKAEREHKTLLNKESNKLFHDNFVMAKYIRQTSPKGGKNKKKKPDVSRTEIQKYFAQTKRT